MDTNNNVATAVLHLGKQSIAIYHFYNEKKIPLFYYSQVPGLDSSFVVPTEY